MNKTQAIFNIATSEVITNARHGLCSEVINKLCGCATASQCDSEDDFINEVRTCAVTFKSDVQRLIESLTDRDAELYASDIAALTEMLNWKYNITQLIELARAEWQETHSETV